MSIVLGELLEPDFSEWVATRPQAIQAAIWKYPPNHLYRLGDDGHFVTILAYEEPESPTGPVTVRVNVSGEFNALMFEREVFGVHLEDLREVEKMPDPGMVALTEPTEVDAAIGILRPIVTGRES